MINNEIGDYKEQITQLILEDEELLKAIVNNNEDFINMPLQTDDIMYNYIFPYRKSDEIFTETKCILTMRFGKFNANSSNHFWSGSVEFYVICHKDLIRTDYGNRYDFIISKLKNIFDNRRDIGIGKTKVTDFGDLDVGNKDYLGASCILKIQDCKGLK